MRLAGGAVWWGLAGADGSCDLFDQASLGSDRGAGGSAVRWRIRAMSRSAAVRSTEAVARFG